MTATAERIVTVHPFEKDGLGVAPFRCVGVVRRVGPIQYVEQGVTVSVGAPGQPMGTCRHCGTGIAECFVIQDATGKRFEVGSTCVEKTYKACADRALALSHKRVSKQVRDEKNDAFRTAVYTRLTTDDATRATLTATPHPFNRVGETALDYALRMFQMSGNAGVRRLAKWLDTLSAATSR